jgi:SOS-response transcriptional repressor LexA
MAFARSDNHLDPDPIGLAELLAPRPERSLLYRVPDDALAHEAIRRGDLLIVEKGQNLRAGALALVRVEGAARIVRVERSGGVFTFAGRPPDAESVEYLAMVSRVLRILMP